VKKDIKKAIRNADLADKLFKRMTMAVNTLREQNHSPMRDGSPQPNRVI
jgi:hypothetical protein